MKTKLIDTYKIPDFFLPLIVNGDSQGLTNEELKALQLWEEKLTKNSNYSHIIIDCPDENNEAYFTWRPDIINLGCNVYDLKVYGVYKTWDM